LATLASRFLSAVDVMNRLLGWAMALCLAGMTVLISWQVFARFVMGTPLSFSEEIARFLMIWLTMLGAAYALRYNALLSVDLLPELLTGRRKFLLSLVAHGISTVFFVVLVSYGWDIAQAVSYQSAPATGLSMFWPMLALAAGGVFCIVNTLAVIVEGIVNRGEAPQTTIIKEAEG
jgi:TRAP-type transport system small permease protein